MIARVKELHYALRDFFCGAPLTPPAYDCAPLPSNCPTCGEKNVTETCGLYASKHDKCYHCGRGIY